jgi:integrase
MSVRRRKWRSRKTGRVHTIWQIHVIQQGPDGVIAEVRKHASINTRRGAEKEERDIRNQIQAGTYCRRGREVPTVEKFQTEFLETYAKKNNKPSVYVEKEKILRLHLVPFFGAYRIDQIPPKAVEDFKAKHTGAPKTLNNKLVVFGRMLRVAAEWKIIPVSSIPPIRMVEAPSPEFMVLDWKTDVQKLLTELEGQALRMALVALHTGLRIGEIRALQWGDIRAGGILVRRNLWRGKITSPKHGKHRTVPLNVEANAALAAQKHTVGLWVFCNPDGTHLGDQQEDNALEHACGRAGIASVKWHALRHTFGTQLASRGVAAKVIQELLGHASLRTTERYMNFAPGARQSAVDLLGGATAQHTDSTKAVSESDKVAK